MNFGWIVKKWPKRHLLSFFFWQELDKITWDKKDAQGPS